MEYTDFKIPVRTEDGKLVGTLAKVSGPFMRVSRGWWRKGYWIPTEYITSATAREIIVGFPVKSLPRYAREKRLAAPVPVERAEAA